MRYLSAILAFFSFLPYLQAGFPSSVITLQDLYPIANDAGKMRLTSTLAADGLVFTVDNAGKVRRYMTLTIRQEILQVCDVAGNQITVCAGRRGLSGTPIQTHPIGAEANGYVTQISLDAIHQELIAIEEFLGPNGSNLPNSNSLPDANGTTRGLLTAADWNLFNSKQAALSYTPENSANKVTSVGAPGDNTNYPTEAAVRAAIEAGLATKQNTIAYTPENAANKVNNVGTPGDNTSYPTEAAVRSAIDAGLATKQNTLSFTPENSSNKVTSVGNPGNNVSYPTEAAVRAAIETGLATKQNTLNITPEDSANKVTSVGTPGDNTKYPTEAAVRSAIDTGLATKQNLLAFTPENVANKDADATLSANSDTRYPTQRAVKEYVDNKTLGSGIQMGVQGGGTTDVITRAIFAVGTGFLSFSESLNGNEKTFTFNAQPDTILFADLPSAAANLLRLFIVRDGNDSCSAGNGTKRCLLQSDGAAWVPVGDAGSGSGAPTTAQYWVSSADGALGNAVNLGALADNSLIAVDVVGGVATPRPATQSDIPSQADRSEALTQKDLDAEATGNTVTIPFYQEYIAAVCQNAAASLGFSTTPTNVPTAVCIAGTNTHFGAAQFTATGQYVQGRFTLPDDWTGAIDLSGKYRSVQTTGNAVWTIQASCAADGELNDPAWTAASGANVITDAVKGTTLWQNDFATTNITLGGTCAAGKVLFFRFGLDAATTAAGNHDLLSIRFKLRRAM